ncbi:MAG: TonB family protein [Marinobacter sp.]
MASLDSASRTLPRPETERPLTPIAPRQPHTPPETLEQKAPSTHASADSAETTALLSKSTDEQESAQRITRTPVEQDPYRVLLATHLAETLEQQRVPAISRLKATVTMELELRIMPNGALTRARVVKSTGVSEIDDAAYRAALAASPYPEPEAENRDRFGVKLVFTPKRT